MKITLKVTEDYEVSAGYGTQREKRTDVLVDLDNVEVSSRALAAGLLQAVADEMTPKQAQQWLTGQEPA